MTGVRFVEEHQAEYRITDLCRLAGVSRSSFYAWRTRRPSARAVANTELAAEIREIHKNSRRTYGAPRVWGQLRRRGRRVGRHRVARLMAAEGLVGAHARRRWRRGRHPAMVPAPDLLERDFTAEASDLRWVADISEFGCLDGKLYLAGIRDLHDHSLVGWLWVIRCHGPAGQPPLPEPSPSIPSTESTQEQDPSDDLFHEPQAQPKRVTAETLPRDHPTWHPLRTSG